MTKNPDLFIDLGVATTPASAAGAQSTTKPKEGFSLFDSIFASLAQEKSSEQNATVVENSSTLQKISIPVQATNQDTITEQNKQIPPQSIKQISPLDILVSQNVADKNLIGGVLKPDVLIQPNVKQQAVIQDVKSEQQPAIITKTSTDSKIDVTDIKLPMGSLFDILELEAKKQTDVQTNKLEQILPTDTLTKTVDFDLSQVTNPASDVLSEVTVVESVDIEIVPKNKVESLLSETVETQARVMKTKNIGSETVVSTKIIAKISETTSDTESATSEPRQVEVVMKEETQSQPLPKALDNFETPVITKSEDKNNNLSVPKSLFDGLFELVTQKVPVQNESNKSELMQTTPLVAQNLPIDTLVGEIEVKIKSLKTSNMGSQAKEEVLNLIYESVQKTSSNITSLMSQKEAQDVFQAQPTLKNIKKSAQLLDLGLQNIEKFEVKVDAKIEPKLEEALNFPVKSELNRLDSVNFTKAMFVTKEIVQDLNLTKEEVKIAQENLTQNITTVKVQENVVNSFESKIIGAKQHMNSFMSEVARTVYENYKPPISAFRIALSPSNLGQIAIVLKNNTSSLDIAMSLTNQNTMEVFSENQATLRQQIAKVFGDNSNINLSFSSQENLNANANSGSFEQSSNKERYFGSSGQQKNETTQDSFEEQIEEQKQSYM